MALYPAILIVVIIFLLTIIGFLIHGIYRMWNYINEVPNDEVAIICKTNPYSELKKNKEADIQKLKKIHGPNKNYYPIRFPWALMPYKLKPGTEFTVHYKDREVTGYFVEYAKEDGFIGIPKEIKSGLGIRLHKKYIIQFSNEHQVLYFYDKEY